MLSFREDGVKGFYKGMPVSWSGIFVYKALYFGLYSTFKDYFKGKNIFVIFMVAQMTTMTARIVAYPIGTLSSRLMMQSCRKDKQYKNTLQAYSKIIRKEGTRGLFKGCGLNPAHSIQGALMLVFYDKLMDRKEK
jgi:solute carrier family 25 (adenine nucleotide translocator) protein 4/5/6/31